QRALMAIEGKPEDQLAFAAARLTAVEETIGLGEISLGLRAFVRHPSQLLRAARDGLREVVLVARRHHAERVCDLSEKGHGVRVPLVSWGHALLLVLVIRRHRGAGRIKRCECHNYRLLRRRLTGMIQLSAARRCSPPSSK